MFFFGSTKIVCNDKMFMLKNLCVIMWLAILNYSTNSFLTAHNIQFRSKFNEYRETNVILLWILRQTTTFSFSEAQRLCVMIKGTCLNNYV